MRYRSEIIIVGVAAMALIPSATMAAPIKETVDLPAQRMNVYIDGRKKYTWVVSNGKRGWRTKKGSYTPFGQRERFYSTKWRMKMPYVTWIEEDCTAIHGTYLTSKLSRPASHGCIRFGIRNAAKFYKLVEANCFWSIEVIVKP